MPSVGSFFPYTDINSHIILLATIADSLLKFYWIDFLHPFQNNPGVHPASYTKGTGSLPGVKQLRRGVDHPPPSTAEVKERVEINPYTTSGPSWPDLD